MRCLKRWWSDPWNKWDVASMVLYFFAFCVPVNGSRYLFALFSFVWCLKFYQFLRKFKSVGTYIIIVQKMVGVIFFCYKNNSLTESTITLAYTQNHFVHRPFKVLSLCVLSCLIRFLMIGVLGLSPR